MLNNSLMVSYRTIKLFTFGGSVNRGKKARLLVDATHLFLMSASEVSLGFLVTDSMLVALNAMNPQWRARYRSSQAYVYVLIKVCVSCMSNQ